MFDQEISNEIWNMKYRWKSHSGDIKDETLQDTWLRIAKALSEAEDNYINLDENGYVEYDNRLYWEEKFYRALEDFKFLPAGRIVSAAGTGRNTTMMNCYTMGTIPDSMDGIFEMLKEAALTMQQGGGIGYDFSTIRPKGAHVKGVDADASGPLTFMDVWDAMCKTVMSAGSRRGAMMGTMRCDHPDVEEFIKAKRDGDRLRMFNMSVLVTDDFMEAVVRDDDWNLVFEDKVYKTVKAKYLWDEIMINTYDYAEPGVLFIDQINKFHNLWYIDDIATTNPCGEQPMPPYAACLLGSINLTKFVTNPFTSEADIDLDLLSEVVQAAVRMMDNVLDLTNYPVDKQKERGLNERRIGLGVTGLADMIAMLCMKYGSEQSINTAKDVLSLINDIAYISSTALAKEKGTFPHFDKEKFLQSEYVKTLPNTIQEAIAEYGIRNATLTSIAPTGTISIYANNVSSGIEPIFAYSYSRNTIQPDGSTKQQDVCDYAVWLYKQIHGQNAELPDYFVTANELSPEEHVKMQAAVQQYVDTSISKTVNLPKEISFEEFKDVYMLAYELGCKGCTTYRPSEVRGAVLVSNDDKPKDEACKLELDPNTGQFIKSCE